MRSAYKFLAWAVVVLVPLQAAFVALAMFGLFSWVDGGGTLDKAAMEGDEALFGEAIGFMLHGMVGMMLIPLLALLLLIVSFFAKVPQGPVLAAAVLGLVVLQVVLGLAGFGIPFLGLVHALNAFLVMGAAAHAAVRAGRAERAPADPVAV